MQTEGMIEKAERRGFPSSKDKNKTVYFVDVTVGGEVYSGGAEFGAKCAGLIDQAGRFVHLDWEADGKYRKIQTWAFIAAKEGLKGADNQWSDKDILIVKQNVSTAAHNIVVAMITSKAISADWPLVDETIDHFYQAGLKRIGLDA